MNFSGKGPPATGKKISIAKAMSLNPNAAEFVPFALRSPSGSTSSSDASKLANSTTSLGKPVLDRSESSVSNNSDDEAHQYWRHQLPDDITPDFKVMGEDDSNGNSGLSFSSLSLADASEAPRFSTSTGSGFMWNDLQEISSSRINGTSSGENMRHHIMSFSEDASSTSFHLPTKPWDKQSLNNDHLFASVTEGPRYGGNSGNSFFADMISEDPFLETDLNPLEFLASQFPGFAAESLADVYYANGGDFNLTMEMLTQLELQVDVGLHQDLNTKALHAPNLSSLDFPALSMADNLNSMPKYNGDDLRQNVNPYRSSENESTLLFKSGSSIPSFRSASSTHSRGAIDFASAVRKMASPDASTWKYDRNGLADATVGSGRKLSVLASSYHGGQSRGVYGDRLQSRGSTRAAPVWLETGEVVESMYSEMREEARDHARLRNTYFEQARQAYLVGNKALAKELSMKGQVHNVQMKAAHGKAQESIYRLRNPVGPEMQGNGRGQERIIDLHGLHVTEAIHVLKRELSVLRNAARSADQRVQVYICVGTGHHTKGSRTPARLPISVQRYLLEEGLDYSEPQPGLLRIVI